MPRAPARGPMGKERLLNQPGAGEAWEFVAFSSNRPVSVQGTDVLASGMGRFGILPASIEYEALR